jgi:hypothetical protein
MVIVGVDHWGASLEVRKNRDPGVVGAKQPGLGVLCPFGARVAYRIRSSVSGAVVDRWRIAATASS